MTKNQMRRKVARPKLKQLGRASLDATSFYYQKNKIRISYHRFAPATGRGPELIQPAPLTDIHPGPPMGGAATPLTDGPAGFIASLFSNSDFYCLSPLWLHFGCTNRLMRERISRSLVSAVCFSPLHCSALTVLASHHLSSLSRSQPS